MLTNQTENFSLEQRSVIKCFVVEKCKQCEIYRTVCDVYGEACFSQKNINEWAKHGFATTCLSQFEIH